VYEGLVIVLGILLGGVGWRVGSPRLAIALAAVAGAAIAVISGEASENPFLILFDVLQATVAAGLTWYLLTRALPERTPRRGE
jgi:hypothetical protein